MTLTLIQQKIGIRVSLNGMKAQTMLRCRSSSFFIKWRDRSLEKPISCNHAGDLC